MHSKDESVVPTVPDAPAARETGSGCLGLTMLLLACVAAAVLLCLLFGDWN